MLTLEHKNLHFSLRSYNLYHYLAHPTFKFRIYYLNHILEPPPYRKYYLLASPNLLKAYRKLIQSNFLDQPIRAEVLRKNIRLSYRCPIMTLSRLRKVCHYFQVCFRLSSFFHLPLCFGVITTMTSQFLSFEGRRNFANPSVDDEMNRLLLRIICLITAKPEIRLSCVSPCAVEVNLILKSISFSSWPEVESNWNQKYLFCSETEKNVIKFMSHSLHFFQLPPWSGSWMMCRMIYSS